MADTEMLTPYQLASSALDSAAHEGGLSAAPLQQIFDRTLVAQGWTPASLTAEQLQSILFPTLDQAYGGLLNDERRKRMLNGLAEQLAAMELGATFAPRAAVTVPSGLAEELENASAADKSSDDEDWDFGEDEFELEDPEYMAAPVARAYNLDTESDQSRLISDLGRVSGVQSVMVCRRSGEVVQARSLKDLSSLGNVVAATVLLLRERSLRLMSAQVGRTVVCVRPLGGYAVAVLADPSVNIGRLLGELGQLQVEGVS